MNSHFYFKTVHDRKVKEHDNSKQKRPYHRTDQDTFLSANKFPQEVCDLLLDESASPVQSNLVSQEPRNLK